MKIEIEFQALRSYASAGGKKERKSVSSDEKNKVWRSLHVKVDIENFYEQRSSILYIVFSMK